MIEIRVNARTPQLFDKSTIFNKSFRWIETSEKPYFPHTLRSCILRLQRLQSRTKAILTQPNPLSMTPTATLILAAIAIFAICAGFVVVRGLTRMIIGTFILAASAYIAFQAWQMAPVLSVNWLGKSLPWFINGLPIAAFLLAFILIRLIVKGLASPFKSGSGEARPPTFVGTIFHFIAALLPTALLTGLGAALIHHTGSVADIRASASASKKAPAFSQQLKTTIAQFIPEPWMKMLDPLTDPSRVELAKLIAAQSDKPLKPVIDAQTGKPIPRAKIVDDPELQKLARDGDFGALLRHPMLTKALQDPKVQKLLKDFNL